MDNEYEQHLPAGRAEREELGIRGFWSKLKRVGKGLPFAEDAVAGWLCATDPRTPSSAKAVLVGALAYFVMPVDLVPDFIAALGFTDDAAVLLAALRTINTHVTPEHREQAKIRLGKMKAEEEG